MTRVAIYAWARGKQYWVRGWFWGNLSRDDEHRSKTGELRSVTRNKAGKYRRFLVSSGSVGPCVVCGSSSGPFELDHIKSVLDGGTSSPDNLRWLCQGCHHHRNFWGFIPGKPEAVACGEKGCLRRRWKHDRECMKVLCRQWFTCSEGHVHQKLERAGPSARYHGGPVYLPQLRRFAWQAR